MPEMDGYEFYMHVKQEMPQIPVVLMTAYYYDKDHIIKRSKLKGLEGAIFKKPVNPAKLRQMLIAMRQKNAAPPKPPMPPPATTPPQPGATR
jgi:CheY-like chemotaxis protein